MEGLTRRILLTVALVTLVLAVVGLFLPVKSSQVSGLLDSGDDYFAEWDTLGYQVVGGYLLLLVSLVNVFVAFRYSSPKTPFSAGTALYWVGYSIILVVSFFFAGQSMIYYWQSWLPPEIQHGIGTPYVSLREQMVRNIPMIMNIYFSVALWVGILSVAVVRRVKREE